MESGVATGPASERSVGWCSQGGRLQAALKSIEHLSKWIFCRTAQYLQVRAAVIFIMNHPCSNRFSLWCLGQPRGPWEKAAGWRKADSIASTTASLFWAHVFLQDFWADWLRRLSILLTQHVQGLFLLFLSMCCHMSASTPNPTRLKLPTSPMAWPARRSASALPPPPQASAWLQHIQVRPSVPRKVPEYCAKLALALQKGMHIIHGYKSVAFLVLSHRPSQDQARRNQIEAHFYKVVPAR